MSWKSRDDAEPISLYGSVVETPEGSSRSGYEKSLDEGAKETEERISIHLKVTQYGYLNDECGDSLTEAGWGAWGNHLTPDSCALTDSARSLLQATKQCRLKIVFPDGKTIYRNFDDRAPEIDPRLDLYMPKGFDKTLPDYADVSLA